MAAVDKNVVALGWVSFFTDLASAMITPLLPVYVVTVLHEGMDKLGVIVALATFVSYALRLVSGYLSDRYGIVKPLVVTGYTLSAFSKPLLAFAQHWQGVAALRATERLGKALRSAPKDAMIAAYGGKRQGRTFGFHKTMDIAGELTGMFVVFVLLYRLGSSEAVIRDIFLWTLLPGLAGVAVLLLFVRDVPKRPEPTAAFTLNPADRAVLHGLLPYFVFLFFMFGDAFFTMQAKTAGIATATLPLLFMVSTGVQTLASYAVGIGVDRYGAPRLLGIGLVAGTAAQALLWPVHPAATWAAYALMGFFTVTTLNAARAHIAANAEHRASVYGVFYAAVALCGGLGATLAGWLWEYVSMPAALGTALAGTAAATGWYLMRSR